MKTKDTTFAAADAEIDRLMKMTEDELRTELAKEGISFDDAVAFSRMEIDKIFGKVGK